jgi:hypothetical protein
VCTTGASAQVIEEPNDTKLGAGNFVLETTHQVAQHRVQCDCLMSAATTSMSVSEPVILRANNFVIRSPVVSFSYPKSARNQTQRVAFNCAGRLGEACDAHVA